MTESWLKSSSSLWNGNNWSRERAEESLMIRYYGWFDEKDVVFEKLVNDALWVGEGSKLQGEMVVRLVFTVIMFLGD
jgi:hypothetical protein